MAKLTNNEVLAKLANAFSIDSTKKKPKRNRILVIDGNIGENMVSKKEAKQIAKRLATTGCVIEIYSLEGVMSTNLDVAITNTTEKDV